MRLPEPPKLPARLEPLVGPSRHERVLEEVTVTGLSWAGETVPHSDLSSVMVDNADLTSAQLTQASWRDVALTGGQGGGLNLDRATWLRVAWARARLSGLILSGAELTNVTFTGCKLDIANFRSSRLKQVAFIGCDLTGADFSDAHLSSVAFTGSNLTETVFHQATHFQTDLRDAQLRDVKGVTGLKDVVIRYDQLIELAPSLAAGLGIIVKDD